MNIIIYAYRILFTITLSCDSAVVIINNKINRLLKCAKSDL